MPEYKFVRAQKWRREPREECLDPGGAYYNYHTLWPIVVAPYAKRVLDAAVNSAVANDFGGWRPAPPTVLVYPGGTAPNEVTLYSGRVRQLDSCTWQAGGATVSLPIVNPTAFIEGQIRGVRWLNVQNVNVSQEKKGKKINAEDAEDMGQTIQRHLDAAAAMAADIAPVVDIIGKFIPPAAVVAKYVEGAGTVAAVLSGALGWILGQIQSADTPDNMTVSKNATRYIYVPGLDVVDHPITWQDPEDEQTRLDSLAGARAVNDMDRLTFDDLETSNPARRAEIVEFMLRSLMWLKDYLIKMYDQTVTYLFEVTPYPDGKTYDDLVFDEYHKYFHDLFAWALDLQAARIINKSADVPVNEYNFVSEAGLTNEVFESTMRMCMMLPEKGFAPESLPPDYDGQVPLLALLQGGQGEINDMIEDYYETEDF